MNSETNSDLQVIDEDGPSQTIQQFCDEENICPSSYYKMRRDGHGPKERRFPGTNIVRITAKSRREWHAYLAKLTTEEAGQLEQKRRVALAKAAGKAAAASPRHVSKRGKCDRADPNAQ